MASPLVTEAETREQLKAQARSILEEVAASLHGRETPSGTRRDGNRLSETIGASRARSSVHASESLRAVVALSEAAMSVVVDHLPPSPDSKHEVAAVALAIQRSIMERVMRAGIAYSNYLLEKVHESHADERRRISRELHDRVAHSIMAAFRSLELYEMYKGKDDASKAQGKLDLAKKTTLEALELTRSLSRELRSTAAEEGLEVALSDLLRTSLPLGVRSWVSVGGDESLITPQVRDELFLTLREGVRNAVAHSGAGTISVELDITRDRLRAAVEDDGRGFDPDEEETRAAGTGLASMKERAALLGGVLDLVAIPGKGTRIEVSLPLPRSGR